jgi:hypothetical protein
MLLMVGPTRGGKGVIASILTALIGKPNVCDTVVVCRRSSVLRRC